MLRPIYGTPIETEEERESKDRERLVVIHIKEIVRRELAKKDQELKGWEEQLRAKAKDTVTAEEKDDADIMVLEKAILWKKEKVKKERERDERDARERSSRKVGEGED